MNKRFRFFIVAVMVGLGAIFMFPTIQWYFLLDAPTKKIVSSSKEAIRETAEKQAEEAVQYLVSLAKSQPDQLFPADKYEYVLKAAKDLYAKAKLPEPAKWTNADVVGIFPPNIDPVSKRELPSSDVFFKAIADHYRTYYLGLKNQKASVMQLGLDLQGGLSAVLQADVTSLEERMKAEGKTIDATTKAEVLNNAVDKLRERADSFGVSEPSIRTDEANMRITIDLPGDSDRERFANILIGGGNLKLQVIDTAADGILQQKLQQFKLENNGRPWRMEDGVPAEWGIPAGTQVRPILKKDEYGIDYISGYTVTRENPEAVVDGKYITKAQPSYDQFGKTVAIFSLDTAVRAGDSVSGAQQFQNITREYQKTAKNQPLAIVMDGKLKGDPIGINSEIGGGNVQITGFSYDEAVLIAKVLRSGSLPVDLKVEGIQEVGASLGEDAIQSGLYAAALGIILVLVFMLVYYIGSGVVANVALLLNIFIMTAVLSQLGFTLTLTSIAGLILTVGMAVDANVIIFERIKEELLLGKSRAAAIKTGYAKALWAILDSNITTIIAAVLLASFGTGPIKGFAYTLTVGIITSLITALFVTRLLQDFGTEQLGQTRMSITWRRK